MGALKYPITRAHVLRRPPHRTGDRAAPGRRVRSTARAGGKDLCTCRFGILLWGCRGRLRSPGRAVYHLGSQDGAFGRGVEGGDVDAVLAHRCRLPMRVDGTGTFTPQDSQPCRPLPLFPLRWTFRNVQCKTRGRADCYSFLVRLLHPLPCRFNPAHPGIRFATAIPD